jgi:hypothetical protein
MAKAKRDGAASGKLIVVMVNRVCWLTNALFWCHYMYIGT